VNKKWFKQSRIFTNKYFYIPDYCYFHQQTLTFLKWKSLEYDRFGYNADVRFADVSTVESADTDTDV